MPPFRDPPGRGHFCVYAPIMKKILTALAALCLAAAAILLPGGPATAADVFPSQDACHAVNNAAPQGDCGPFDLLYRETFNAAPVPVGTFRDCAGDGDFRCEGARGTRYYTTLGAYPRGWYDTANPRNHSNGNDRTFGGEYRADDTMSVVRSAPGADGMMRVRMYRPSGAGDNHVAAPVPLKCMNLRYGKFTERFRVRSLTDGFKVAHLRYTPNEIDYPEAGGNFAGDPVSLFNHGFDEFGKDVAPNSAWLGWHTYSLELTPGHVKAYLDGRLVVDRAADFPDAAAWILQNESSLSGGYAAHGSSVILDSTWLACYAFRP